MSLWGRLRQRRLVEWAIAYAAGAWLVMQVVEVLGGRWAWPTALQRATDIVLLVGFFAALVVGWYHGERGRQRVSGAELLILAMLFFIGGIGVSLVAASGAGGPAVEQAAVEVPTSESDFSLDAVPGLAVLPFSLRSQLEEDQHFVEGIHDELLTALQRIAGLKVISNTTVQAYRQSEKTIPVIGAELDVEYVLEGGVQRAGDRIRINLQLIDARNEGHIWAETYDRAVTTEALLETQSEVVRAIAGVLGVTLREEEFQRVARRATSNLKAYELFQRGQRAGARGGQAGSREAIQFYGQAVQEDPGFVMGHAALARTNARLYQYQNDFTPEVAAAAHTAAERAIELDASSVDAQLAMAIYLYRVEKDYEGALHWLDGAAGSLRGDHEFHYYRALATRRMGRWDEAIESFKSVIALNPQSSNYRRELGLTLLYLHRYDEADRHLLDSQALDEDNSNPRLDRFTLEFMREGRTELWSDYVERYDEPVRRWRLAMVTGDPPAALRTAQEGPDFISWQYFWYPRPLLEAWAYELAGDTVAAAARFREAMAILEARVSETPEDERYRASLGLVYAAVDRDVDAVREARRAVELMPYERDALAAPYHVFSLAAVYARIGQISDALATLDGLLSRPSRFSPFSVERDFLVAPIRDRPDFRELMDRHRGRVF